MLEYVIYGRNLFGVIRYIFKLVFIVIKWYKIYILVIIFGY